MIILGSAWPRRLEGQRWFIFPAVIHTTCHCALKCFLFFFVIANWDLVDDDGQANIEEWSLEIS